MSTCSHLSTLERAAALVVAIVVVVALHGWLLTTAGPLLVAA